MSTHGQYSECDWFYHAPRKPVNKSERVEVQLPPTSQIPGLGDRAEPHKEITFENRRKWIRDTDSDFIKLSKQGGRPDLLRHHTPPPKKTSPILYLQPDWYVHGPPSPRSTEVPKWYLPEYMVHHEFTPKYSDAKRAAQLAEKKLLQREAEDNEKENKRKVKLKLPAIGNKTQKEKMFGSTTKKIESSKTARGDHLANKCTFPPMPLPRIEEPVNITKLVSNGYADDWIQQRKEEKKGLQNMNIKEESEDLVPLSKFQKKIEHKELLRQGKSHGKKTISGKGAQKNSHTDSTSDSKSKTSFILNKFRNVPARIDAHRQDVKTEPL